MNPPQSLPPISTNPGEVHSNSRQTPTRRNLVPRSTSLVGATSNTLPLFQNETVSADEKLNEQFRYFRSEYVEAANTSGVAVPLVIVEDKSGQVYKFVYHGGPKYLFEVIQANLENIHLLRCSLSLLIIIITLLRRKIPDPNMHKESGGMYSGNTDSITAWVVDTLAKIGDATAVSVCINILITTYNPSVQELALSLLASILMVSDEAVAHMLLPYSSSGTATVIDNNDDTVRRSSGKRANSGRIPSVEELESAGGAAEIKQDHHPATVAKSIDIKKLNLNFSYNTMDYSSKKVVHEKPKKVDKPKTCLSYVLSVILLQKNRHLLAAGCADIILAMLRKNKRDMSEAIAQTPTCELPAIDDRKGKNDTRSSLSKFNAQSEEHAAHTSAPLSTTIIEWAGLKLLLKFIFRYEKMNAQSKTATKAIVRESVSASLHLKEEYAYAHSKVFTAVCQLIAGSAIVAAYANTLSGAEQLLTFTFNRFDASDSQIYNIFVACTNALAQDKLVQQRRHAHEQEMLRFGGHCPADGGDLRLSDFMLMRSSCPEKICENRPVSPKELRERLNKKKPILGGSTSPSKASGTSKRSKGVLHVSASADGRLGAGPRKEVLNEAVELNRNITVNFQSEYQVETEKRELYLLNSYDAKYGTHATGDLKALSKQAHHAARQTPLSYHPEVDNLIGTSLESMGAAALKPITDPRPKLTETQRREAEFLLGGPHSEQDESALNAPSITSSSVAQTSQTSSYPPRQMRRNEEDEHVFANSQAFFSSLPTQPVVPLRIEPKDVIVPMEDLAHIRRKFQTMAETAQKRGCKEAGSRASQQELIRRAYGPRKFKFHDPYAPSPQYPEEGAHAGGHLTGSNSPDRSRSPTRDRDRNGIAPIQEQGDYFASFSDASGTAFTDMPIQPGAIAAGRDALGGLEGMDFSVDHQQMQNFSLNASTTTSEGPDLHGLRLENFDFDEQNLFEGFKPIFGNPNPLPDAGARPGKKGPAADPDTLAELGIGRKNKPDMKMAQTVDLILS